MTWVQKNKYYLQNGEYTIAKTGTDEWTRYTLFHGSKRIDTFMTADEAKAKHREIAK